MDPTDKWLFDTFIIRNEKNEYIFDTEAFSAAMGEIVNPETAKKGEAQIVGKYLAQQITLM